MQDWALSSNWSDNLCNVTHKYGPAKWLEEKLKTLSVNKYTVSDLFQLAEEIQKLQFNDNYILVS